jgi:hypothetical protein
MNTNVTIQTFWDKYKVIISGAVMALFTAISPLITEPKDQWDYRSIAVAAIIAVATFLGQEARGKNWTILGQVAAAMIAIGSGIEGNLDIVRIIVAAFISFISVPIPPIKLSTYEKSSPILEAKEEAVEIKKLQNTPSTKSDDVTPT